MMSLSKPRNLASASLIGAFTLLTPVAQATEQGQIITANYGSANLPASLGQLVCPEAPGRDGMPVHFESELAGPVFPEDFVVRRED